MDKKYLRIAKFNRGYLIYILILLSIVIAQLLGHLKLALLFMGISCFLYGLYLLCGYLLRWKSMFCTYQFIYRRALTPENADWSTLPRFAPVIGPICYGTLGVALLVLWLIRR